MRVHRGRHRDSSLKWTFFTKNQKIYEYEPELMAYAFNAKRSDQKATEQLVKVTI